MKLYYLFILAGLLLACTSETDEPVQLKVRVNSNTESADLYWDNLFNTTDSVVYRIYLNEKLIDEVKSKYYFSLINLTENTNYQGKITAVSPIDKREIQGDFSFSTNKNEPPWPFEITINAIRGNGITISWTRAVDPDGSAVKYDIRLDDKLIAENIEGTKFTLSNANELSSYTLYVRAKDKQNSFTETSVKFSTLKYGAELLHKTANFEGLYRSFNVFKPSIIGTEKLPLVIFLHGYGGVVWPDMITDSFIDVAEKEKFLLLKPQAFSVSPGLPAWDSYSMRWDDTKFLTQLIDSMLLKYQADPERIYITGFSNGGFMTFFLAKKFETRIAAVAPIAGLMDYYSFANFSLQKPMPLCYMHGTADSTVRVFTTPTHQGWDKVLGWFVQHNKANATPLVTEMEDTYKWDYSTVTKLEYSAEGSADIVYYRVNGGNHSIPGVQPWSNKDISAYQVIWEFFKPRKLSDK